MKRVALVAAAVAAIAPGFVSTPATAATIVDVAIIGNTAPYYGKGTCAAPGANSVTITVGDTVRWSNCDLTTHTVTHASFDSGNITATSSYSHQFNTSGFFTYICKIHPETMTGTVVVNPPPATVPPPTSAKPTTTTAKPTTTAPTSTSTTSTTIDLSGVFDTSSTTSSSSTTSTTTADESDDDGSSSGLIVGLLVLAIAGVGGGAYAVWRRMQQTG